VPSRIPLVKAAGDSLLESGPFQLFNFVFHWG
jgi:hypothetical protein